MRLPLRFDGEAPTPSVDDVSFRSLYVKTQYIVDTADGWSLVVHRYRPKEQAFPQPLWGEPLLLVHGFSQNRHAWTSGQFVKNMLFFGVDIHILELRGHGRSSIELQRERARKFQRPLPTDLDYGWDLDSYFLYDIPAAVNGVKRVTGRQRVFYCGHSMGGMLGYGYAGIHDDLEGLITIGSAADLGRGFLLLRMLSLAAPAVSKTIDLAFSAFNLEQRVSKTVQRWFGKKPPKAAPVAKDGVDTGALEAAAVTAVATAAANLPARFRFLPVDALLRGAADVHERAESHPLFRRLSRLNTLTNATRVAADDIRWLLREGGEKEPRGVVEQFAKWIRRGELVCHRTGYDFKRGFSKIDVPMAIIFGDMDPLASVESTRSVYRAAQSEYLLWRPVKGNSHIELTMGHDIRQICYDVKNLIEYARTHRTRRPTMPRSEARPEF